MGIVILVQKYPRLTCSLHGFDTGGWMMGRSSNRPILE